MIALGILALLAAPATNTPPAPPADPASSTAAAPPEVTETVPFGGDRWVIRGGETRPEQHLGRDGLWVKGAALWVKDVELLDGTLEFDVSVSGERGFVGAAWRLQDEGDYEAFYVRPHMSGNPDATQYTPVYHGVAAWQLYHGEGYSAPVQLKTHEWMHVKIVVSGTQAEVYLDSEKPVLFIRELKRLPRPGRIGLVATGAGAAHFANFTYSLAETPPLKAPPANPAPGPEAAPGIIRTWRLSSAFDEAALDGKFVLGEADIRHLTWDPSHAEPNGLVNIAAQRSIGSKSDTVFARVTIRSDRIQVKKVFFGYSDRVKAYSNGRLIYSGTNVYQSRDYRFLGTIGLFDALYLPLRKGENELWFAVSESFGGWGLMARLEDEDGVSLIAPAGASLPGASVP